ncbi:MAG: hypothetical protein QGG00_00760 [Verrucomicrobiota bacterium]|jgi:ABC-type transporter Mla subunit MlaD|nr:hypothetical protein [Verrucomicrobiota bacterium]
MKRPIPSFACLVLTVGCLCLPTLGRAQNDALPSQAAAPDLGPVIERLDQVVAGLTKVAASLAKLQKASNANAKERSLENATKQLGDLNAAVESLAGQLSSQAKVAGHQAAAAAETAKLLEKLVALQQAGANQASQSAPKVQWEYKSIFGDSRVALEEEMNQFGEDGWEFFNITSFGRGSAAFARRPIEH